MNKKKRKTLIENKKTENASVEDDSIGKFHWLIVGVIWISIIFFGIRGVISSFTNMIFSPTIGVITLVLSIVGMVSLFFILQAKKWALFLWIAYRLAGAVVNSLINTKFDFATNVIVALVNIGIMLLILQLKKNGVSAWSLIFKKKASKIDDTENVAEDITHKTRQCTTSEQNERMIRVEQRKGRTENFTEIPPQDIEDTLYDEQINHTIPAEDRKLEQQEISTTPPTDEKLEDKLIGTPGIKLKSTGCRDDTPEKKKSLFRRSWWIFLIVIVTVLVAFGIVVVPHHRDRNPEIGEYVYVDKYSILHLDRNCENIAVFHGAKPVSIYSMSEFTANNWNQICSNCIDDKKYERLNILMIRNENRYWLYNTLEKEGCDMGDYSEFSRYIETQEDYRWCYDKLKSRGYVLPKYEEYIIQMGLDSIHSATKKITYEKSNKRLLYDDLIEEYDMGGFEQFSEDVDNIEKRKKLFHAIRNQYEIPSFDYFTRYLLDNEK
ncbi:MAG: hypothetical protein KBT45_05365 [Bacteroidales bacterium]|nr:hypothetical protein [Candidatus Colimorpha pelethequi]